MTLAAVIAPPPQLTTFPSVTNARGAPAASFSNNQQVRAIKHTSGGPGNDYYWDSSGTDADNDGSVIRTTDNPAPAPGVLRILPKLEYSSTDFDCPGDGTTEVLARLNAGLLASLNDGKRSFFIAPGVHRVDRANPMIVPAPPGSSFTLRGVRGQSIIKAIGTNWPTPPSFPQVGLGMLCTGDPVSKNRYLTETGRVASVTGLTANLTVVSGSVTAAAVVAGGNGGKLLDTVRFTDGSGHSATFQITGTAAYKGAVTALTLVSSTTGWGAPSNPVAMSSSTGQALWDRILDPTTLGGEITLDGLVLDGNWGGGYAVFTGAISGTVMTVSAIAAGAVQPGQSVKGVASNTSVVNQLTGTPGGIGTYTVSVSQTVASGTLNAFNPPLTGGTSNTYKGAQLTGHDIARIVGCKFQNFPNDGYSMFDCRTHYVDETTETFNNGWTGVQTTSRNGGSHYGIYVTTNPQLCSSAGAPSSIRGKYTCTGDVPLNHQFMTGVIVANILDYGTLGLEGAGNDQSAPFPDSNIDASGETFANNGGVIIPSDVKYAGTVVDGARVISASWSDFTPPNGNPFTGSPFSNIPYGLDGISDTAGNQGKKEFSGVTVRNTIRRAIFATQGFNGNIDCVGGNFYYVGRGYTGILGNPVFEFKGWRVRFNENKVQGYFQQQGESSSQPIGSGSVIVLSNPGGDRPEFEINDNQFEQIGFQSLVQVGFFTFNGTWFRMRGNVVANMWGAKLVDWNQGSNNNCYFQDIEIDDNTLINIQNNPSSAFTTPNFNLTTSGTGKLDCDRFSFRRNRYLSNSASKLDPSTPILNLNAASLRAWGVVNISYNETPGFTLYAIGGSMTIPTTTITDSNH